MSDQSYFQDQVPEDIEYCCDEIVKDLNDPDRVTARGIKSEKTDNYQYTKFTMLEGAGPILSEVCSNPRVTSILNRYVAPAYVSVA
jgi:uncharacterized membrane protein